MPRPPCQLPPINSPVGVAAIDKIQNFSNLLVLRLDHIVGNSDDRNRCRGLLCSANCNGPGRINDIDVSFDKLLREFRNQINTRAVVVPIKGQVLTFDEAMLAKIFNHWHKK